MYMVGTMRRHSRTGLSNSQDERSTILLPQSIGIRNHNLTAKSKEEDTKGPRIWRATTQNNQPLLAPVASITQPLIRF